MRCFSTCLFALVSSAAVYAMELDRLVPRGTTLACVLIFFSTSIVWFRIISPKRR